MKPSKWDRRIARADELATTHPFASEVLQFYKHLAGLQRAVYLDVEQAHGGNHGNSTASLLGCQLDVDLLMPKFRQFLSNLEADRSQPIAQSAKDLSSQHAGRCLDLLLSAWENASDFQPALANAESLLAWLFLQPYAENFADHNAHAPLRGTPARCPFCLGKPQVGVLRPEGVGAKRFLICSLCSTEWAYGRIKCPACGEETVDKLAIYTASQFNHVRVEGCDTCGRYIKTVDLTKNGLAVPVVDELATIPLNFWAYEHGYAKMQTNLLGI
jgi:FdhE protein